MYDNNSHYQPVYLSSLHFFLSHHVLTHDQLIRAWICLHAYWEPTPTTAECAESCLFISLLNAHMWLTSPQAIAMNSSERSHTRFMKVSLHPARADSSPLPTPHCPAGRPIGGVQQSQCYGKDIHYSSLSIMNLSNYCLIGDESSRKRGCKITHSVNPLTDNNLFLIFSHMNP